MSRETECRERLRDMLKVKLSARDIVCTLLSEFKELTYEKIRKIIFEETVKHEKNN